MTTTILNLTFTDTLIAIKCSQCGVAFGLAASFQSERRKDHDTFYCPNGHRQHYPQDSEADRLRKQLAQTERCLNFAREDSASQRRRANVLERRVAANRGVVTRMKNRISSGKCVCCSKQFRDLERHMKSQHPDWNPEKHVEALSAKTPNRSEP